MTRTWWREFLHALAGRTADDDPDQCGDPAPPLIGHFSTGWCVRRPGHGVPHRDRDGAEWVRHVEPLSAQACDRCIPGPHGQPLDTRTYGQTPCIHIRLGRYLKPGERGQRQPTCLDDQEPR